MTENRRPPPGGATWKQRIDAYERLVRLDKPIGILLLLWPTLTALWLASFGAPTVVHIIVFTAGTVVMRGAGCALNDWADRDFDAHVARTAGRPLAQGEIAPWEALVVAAVLAGAAFVLVAYGTNLQTVRMSVAALAVAIAYPFCKRFLAVPQAFLGIAFSFGIPMAYMAVRGAVPWWGWLLFAANLFWVIAYDTEYAMVDRDDDVRLGLRTSAITFGRLDVAAIACCYALYFGGLAWVAAAYGLGGIFWAGFAVAAGLAGYHVWLIRTRERARCFRAFLSNHWLGFAVFAGVALDYAIRLQAWPRLG
jgi:4-hydroxybenzoate polyprenyltransferase